jgi:uncharacterized protein with ParB-like and HNH nuclease domain/predicted transport protein
MKATEANFLTFVRKSQQYVIPIYQRAYSWTAKECLQLWNDIVRSGRDSGIQVHFLGSIVYIEEGLSTVSQQSPLLVIDGQQRLTTITLLLSALAKALGDYESIDGFSNRKLRHYYLVNSEEVGDRRYKLILGHTDRATLISTIDDIAPVGAASIRIDDNFKLFQELIAKAETSVDVVLKGLSKLVIVEIALKRGEDNPQLIFESMNSTGRELSQADLIRNYVLMGLEPKLQTRLYEQYWRPMELSFGQKAYTEEFDAFVRYYLTLRTGEIPNISDVYEAFKAYARNPIDEDRVEGIVKDLQLFARYYAAVALGAEKDTRLRKAFNDLRELRVDVAYPLLLETYDDCINGILSPSELEEIIRLIEAYVFRRMVCSIPANSLNKTFATLARKLDKTKYIESLKARLLLLPSYRRFPKNDEFVRELQVRDLYHSRIRSYWLVRVENHLRKEPIGRTEYTIEHILPQNENLSNAWREALGPEWQRIRDTWLHTIGNLTLTGYNSEYSDRPFLQKRDMSGGFRESTLRVNAGLGNLDSWSEASIRERATKLTLFALDVWPLPEIEETVLASYRKPITKGGGYTIADHPNLGSEKLTGLFQHFRREVLALDECVTEEFLKYYVAYKAETNFVDVYPQAKRIRLILNLPFDEIIDPQGKCTDVTGYQLNGEVRVYLSSVDELPYIMNLVVQAFEYQMGSTI